MGEGVMVFLILVVKILFSLWIVFVCSISVMKDCVVFFRILFFLYWVVIWYIDRFEEFWVLINEILLFSWSGYLFICNFVIFVFIWILLLLENVWFVSFFFNVFLRVDVSCFDFFFVDLFMLVWMVGLILIVNLINLMFVWVRGIDLGLWLLE